MTSQREAIAQAIHDRGLEYGLLHEHALALADAVLPLVEAAYKRGQEAVAYSAASWREKIEAEAEQRGYANGKVDGMRGGYNDGYVQAYRNFTGHDEDDIEEAIKQAEQRGYERGLARSQQIDGVESGELWDEARREVLAEARAKITAMPLDDMRDASGGPVAAHYVVAEVIAVLDELQAPRRAAEASDA